MSVGGQVGKNRADVNFINKEKLGQKSKKTWRTTCLAVSASKDILRSMKAVSTHASLQTIYPLVAFEVTVRKIQGIGTGGNLRKKAFISHSSDISLSQSRNTETQTWKGEIISESSPIAQCRTGDKRKWRVTRESHTVWERSNKHFFFSDKRFYQQEWLKQRGRDGAPQLQKAKKIGA